MFIAVKSCVQKNRPQYVEVEADKVDPVPKQIKNSDSLVNFIEEVKEINKKQGQELEGLTPSQIEAKEIEERKRNAKRIEPSKKKTTIVKKCRHSTCLLTSCS